MPVPRSLVKNSQVFIEHLLCFEYDPGCWGLYVCVCVCVCVYIYMNLLLSLSLAWYGEDDKELFTNIHAIFASSKDAIDEGPLDWCSGA